MTIFHRILKGNNITTIGPNMLRDTTSLAVLYVILPTICTPPPLVKTLSYSVCKH